MTGFKNYLTDEVVEDYSDGIITRREALRRLSLLGVGAAVALPLLAACDAAAPESGTASPAGSAPAASPASPAAPGTPAGPTPLPTEAITFAGPDGRTLQGAWAAATSRAGPSWSSTRTAG